MAKRRKTKGSSNIGSFLLLMLIASGISKCMGGDSKDSSKVVANQTQSFMQSTDVPKTSISPETITEIQKKENTQIAINKPTMQAIQKESAPKITKLSEPTTKQVSRVQNQINTTTKTKQVKTNKKSNIAQPASFQCGGKHYCSQMNNCAEAKFYLKQCGVKSLDRDRDGVPCESICG